MGSLGSKLPALTISNRMLLIDNPLPLKGSTLQPRRVSSNRPILLALFSLQNLILPDYNFITVFTSVKICSESLIHAAKSGLKADPKPTTTPSKIYKAGARFSNPES